MKRELTASPSPAADDMPDELSDRQSSPLTAPSTPKKPKSSPKKKSPANAASPANGQWTPEKKEELVRRVFEVGLANMDKAQLSADLGLSKTQINNATQNGQKNLRSKLIALAATM